MTPLYDHIVVGSGATGAMAAQTLVEGGARVAMLDVGSRDGVYKGLIPAGDFTEIRKGDESQHRYFLGDRFEGIPWNSIRVGAQLTPPRQFIHRDVERWIPLLSESFKPLESLAYGGLGSGWGLMSFVFSRREIEALGLADSDLRDAYKTVVDRIGVSGGRDDGAEYTVRDLDGFDPPLEMDENIAALYAACARKNNALKARGIIAGRPPLAVITRDRGDRKAFAYRDMDFWSDADRSAYRPWITVDQLLRIENFSYHGGCLVLRFTEHEDKVEVAVRRTDTNETESYFCRRLILAGGVLGTARIVLRSVEGTPARLPVICNSHCYVPSIHLRRIGSAMPRHKSGLCQLSLFHDPEGENADVATANFYTYRSLLLFKLIKEAPLGFADGRVLMQRLQSSFVIAGIFHPEAGGKQKFLEMESDPASATGDRLRATYHLSDEEKQKNDRREREICSALRMLGCLPIRRIDPGAGSSIHYGGTLPYADDEKPFTLARDGRLHGFKNVYAADGSGFRFLPAKGLTLTLMANAHRVAARTIG